MKRLKALVILVYIGSISLAYNISFADTNSIPKMSPIFALQGSWEEIGKTQAYYFPDLMIQTLSLFYFLLGITGDDTQAYYQEIEHLVPESIKKQLQGMATGLSEYWSIPYDIACSMVLILPFGMDVNSSKQAEGEKEGCTAFALYSNDGTFLCHNTDDMPQTLNIYGINHFIPDNGDNAFISFGVPQVFVGVGMAINEKGLGITYNAGRPNKNASQGLPVMLMMREVMAKCDTLDDAVNYFTDFLTDGGNYGYGAGNLILVDFKGPSMARLQVCSDDIKVTYGQELKPGVTFVACTNHFDDDFSPLAPEDLSNPSNISSQERLARLMEMLPQFEKYDIDTCWDILTDHGDGEPNNNTICRKGDTWHSVFANIFTESETYYTLGPSCDYLPLYGEPIKIDHEQCIKPSITGIITAMGRPLAQAQVRLEGVSEQGINLKTYSAEDGTFVFNNLVSGTYKIRVKKTFHLPGMAVVEFKEGEQQTVDINLLF